MYHFPLNVFAFTVLGEVLKAAGKLAEAESVYRETVQRFPDNVVARNGLAGVLKAGGKLAEAESVYRETVQCFPNDVFARNGLAEVLKAGRQTCRGGECVSRDRPALPERRVCAQRLSPNTVHLTIMMAS